MSNIPALPPIIEDSPSKSKKSQITNGGHFAQRSGKQMTSEVHPMHLESRVSALEQANRSLLEELVRLHSELKAESRRRDDVLTAARSDVDRLHHDVAALQGDVKVFSEKLSEDSLHKEEQITETMAYVKNLESQTSVSLGGLVHKQANCISRIVTVEKGMERQFCEVWSEVERVKTSSRDTQGLLTAVQSDTKHHLGQLESSCDGILSKISTLDKGLSLLGTATSELQQRVDRLSQQVEEDRRSGASRFAALEGQLDQASVAIIDIQKHLVMVEKKMADRMSALEVAMVSGFSERDCQLDVLSSKLNDSIADGIKERQQLSSTIQTMAEEVNKEIAERERLVRKEILLLEKKAREELLEEVNHTKLFVEEKTSSLRADLTGWRAVCQERADVLDGTLKRTKSQNNKVFTALSDSIKLVQREGETSRKHLSNVIHAEVTVRLRELDNLNKSLRDLKDQLDQELLKLATAQRSCESSQQALRDQLARTSSNMLSTLQHTTARALADVDSRFRNAHSVTASIEHQLVACNKKIATAMDELDKTKADIHQQFLKEQKSRKSDVDHVTTTLNRYLTLDEYHSDRRQGVEQVRQMDLQINQMKPELSALQRSVNLMHLQTANQMKSERSELRNMLTSMQAYLDIRGEEGGHPQGTSLTGQDTGLTGQDTGLTGQDMGLTGQDDEHSGGSMDPQEVINPEGQLRESLLEPSSNGVSSSEAANTPDIILDPPYTEPTSVDTPPPRPLIPRSSSTFIKYEEDTEEPDNSLNQWGLYQAWRLLKIKEAWMKPLRRRNKNDSS